LGQSFGRVGRHVNALGPGGEIHGDKASNADLILLIPLLIPKPRLKAMELEDRRATLAHSPREGIKQETSLCPQPESSSFLFKLLNKALLSPCNLLDESRRHCILGFVQEELQVQ
jgi:hypothetical protein